MRIQPIDGQSTSTSGGSEQDDYSKLTRRGYKQEERTQQRGDRERLRGDQNFLGDRLWASQHIA